MLEETLQNVKTYTKFDPGEELLKLGGDDGGQMEGVCLSLCLHWLLDHRDVPDRAAAQRMGLLSGLMKGVKRRQKRYTEANQKVRDLNTEGVILNTQAAVKLAELKALQQKVGKIDNDTLMKAIGEVDGLQAEAKKKLAEAESQIVRSGELKMSKHLLEFVGQMKLTLDLPNSSMGVINPGKGQPYLDLVAKLKAHSYWLLALPEHAICAYAYEPGFFASVAYDGFVQCFDPNFGEFYVLTGKSNAALFFLQLLNEPPYRKYKDYTLYHVA
jgi:hypothetical protein